MKQITQNLKTGKSTVVDVPVQMLQPGHMLIQSHTSLISAGTERMLVDFGKSSYLQKAKQQPDKVKEVIQKIKTDGLITTYDAVKTKLDQPMPMGYCNVGTVVAIGAGVDGFSVGDRVASNGAHAEYVSVPKNLCAKVPEGVADESAAFTVLGSVALQSVRLIKPELGEIIIVSGLGLVGLLAVQFLRSHGCRVIGLDFNSDRLKLAEKYGAQTIDLSKIDDPVGKVSTMISQAGVDAVLIAAATKSNDPVSQAAKMCRQRGRIVLVGVTGLELSRADFYEKELSFQVSCSYGPGRYDNNYERKGHDYPFGFVRWTEQRNFQAVLHSMKEGWLDVDDLITNEYLIDQTESAYETLLEDKFALGILLKYPKKNLPDRCSLNSMRTINLPKNKVDINSVNLSEKINVSVIGAGNYSSRILIPAFKKSKVVFDTIYANTGLSCQSVARKYNFKKASTDLHQLWENSDSNIVVIATRHDSHADLICKALNAEKHVFVEKPLALTLDEINQIEKAYCDKKGKFKLMVGFNRRFSPLTQKMKQLLDMTPAAVSINMLINAGFIPSDHWTQSSSVGGGRIVGEACHFIDLARFLVGSKIIKSDISYLDSENNKSFDTAIITLNFSNGSIATINYFANGHKSMQKERIEVFSEGKILKLDNFRKLIGYGWPRFGKMSLLNQNKGQNECVASFIDAIKSHGQSALSFHELIEVSRQAVLLSNKK